MKKSILTLAVLTSLSSMAFAAEEAAPDMSDPTDVYTTLGFGYGNQGLDISSMLLLSSTETHKSGIIFDAKNVFDEDNHLQGKKHMYNPVLKKNVHNTSYRLRWGKINTTNGLGLTVDAVNTETAFGRTSIVQAGTLATLPIGDDLLIFPIAFVGGVIAEDNSRAELEYASEVAGKKAAATDSATVYNNALKTSIGTATGGLRAPTQAEQLAAVKDATDALTFAVTTDAVSIDDYTAYQTFSGGSNVYAASALASSDGMKWKSTVVTGMVYVRYGITDNLWALGSWAMTKEIQGMEWNTAATEGGLGFPEQQYDITLGYQITATQNITALYGSNSDANSGDGYKWKVGYNYAF